MPAGVELYFPHPILYSVRWQASNRWIIMPNCHLCAAEDAPSHFEGRLVEGGFGQFDRLEMVALDGPIGASGPICDSCLGKMLSEGRLEIYADPDIPSPGRRLELPVYEALFRAGAERVRQKFHEVNGSRVYLGRTLDAQGREAIIELAELLSSDDTWSQEILVEHPFIGRHALAVGECYAISAISLGYGEEDPGFAAAARHWAERRCAADDLLEESRIELEDLDP